MIQTQNDWITLNSVASKQVSVMVLWTNEAFNIHSIESRIALLKFSSGNRCKR